MYSKLSPQRFMDSAREAFDNRVEMGTFVKNDYMVEMIMIEKLTRF